MAHAGATEELYALERVELDEDSDDDFQYTELPIDDDELCEDDGDDFGADDDEDLEMALASMKGTLGGGGGGGGGGRGAASSNHGE